MENKFCDGYIAMIKYSSRFSKAQGPDVLYKENTKLQQKTAAFIILFRGIRSDILFCIQHCAITLIASCGKDGFSQVGVGSGSSVCTHGLTNYTTFQVISRLLSFSSRNL